MCLSCTCVCVCVACVYTVGIIFTYCTIQLQLWWLFHLSLILWSICQPFKYQKIKNSGMIKYIYIILIIIGILLPSLPTIITTSRFSTLQDDLKNTTIIHGGIGYIPFTWPPILSGSFNINNDMHTFILHVELLLAIGGPLLFISFYALYKVSSMDYHYKVFKNMTNFFGFRIASNLEQLRRSSY